MKKDYLLAELFAEMNKIYDTHQPVIKVAIQEAIFIINHTENQKEKQIAILTLTVLLFGEKDL